MVRDEKYVGEMEVVEEEESKTDGGVNECWKFVIGVFGNVRLIFPTNDRVS